MPEAPILPFIQWRIDELAKPKQMELNVLDKSLAFISDFTNKILNNNVMPFIVYILIVFYTSTLYLDLVYLYIAGIILMAFCSVQFKSGGIIIGLSLFAIGSLTAVLCRYWIMQSQTETERLLSSL